ncbi:TetR family transcriptional regulator [Brucella endophytica]|uniref:TetR family transcriptional regulator n=1 Tax=Brucella endophytica TaxID=1963359 RepID=A0A916WCM2_9HYPH|nr:TetR/AcrR family transcriptional regulator [Brucella endophytica]GGA85998.1 TetR family transcriptional regulator [Brucella endophytica]
MGRKRTIDREAILNAAETVVARDGAARLTLDAVAMEASVSKATVLYDYKSKRELIAAVVERAVGADNAFNEAAVQAFGEGPSAVIRGRIAAASHPFPDEFRSVALNLCAALAQDAELRKTIQKNQKTVIERISETAASPRGALLAYLALEGLKLLETLDYHSWQPNERARIIKEIAWLVNASPEEVDPPPPENMA